MDQWFNIDWNATQALIGEMTTVKLARELASLLMSKFASELFCRWRG